MNGEPKNKKLMEEIIKEIAKEDVNKHLIGQRLKYGHFYQLARKYGFGKKQGNPGREKKGSLGRVVSPRH